MQRGKRDEMIAAIWAKLTEYNRCCSCCDGDSEYITLVNDIGGLIDGRRWVMTRDPETGKRSYLTEYPDAGRR